MLTSNSNLPILSGRYGDVERRLPRVFADRPDAQYIDLPGGLEIFLYYLLNDKLLVNSGMAPWAPQIQGTKYARALGTDRSGSQSYRSLAAS